MFCLFCNQKLLKHKTSNFDYCKLCDVDFWIVNNEYLSIYINIIFNNKNFCLVHQSDDNFVDLKILKVYKYNILKNSESKRWITIHTFPIEIIKDKTLNQIKDKIKKYIILI